MWTVGDGDFHVLIDVSVHVLLHALIESSTGRSSTRGHSTASRGSSAFQDAGHAVDRGAFRCFEGPLGQFLSEEDVAGCRRDTDLVGEDRGISFAAEPALDQQLRERADSDPLANSHTGTVSPSAARESRQTPNSTISPGRLLSRRVIEVAVCPGAAQNRPTVFPSASMSMCAAAGSDPKPGIVCICPQIG